MSSVISYAERWVVNTLSSMTAQFGGVGFSSENYVWVKKSPLWWLVAIFPKRLRIFQTNFICLLCVPIDARLRIFIQLPVPAKNVHHRPKRTLAFSAIFPKQLGIFRPNFTCLLNVHVFARMQIFIQLSPTVTKLCHIKCDHPACVSVDGGNFEHIMVVTLNMT